MNTTDENDIKRKEIEREKEIVRKSFDKTLYIVKENNYDQGLKSYMIFTEKEKAISYFIRFLHRHSQEWNNLTTEEKEKVLKDKTTDNELLDKFDGIAIYLEEISTDWEYSF